MRILFPFIVITGFIAGCSGGGGVNDGSTSGAVTDIILDVNPVDPANPHCPTNTYTNGDYTILIKIVYNSGRGVYYALVGPHAQIGLMSDGSIFVCSGWIYIWTEGVPVANPWPWVQSADVDVGADGCAFGVEKLAGLTNVYYTRGTRAKVKARGAATFDYNNDHGKVQVVSGGHVQLNAIVHGSHEESLLGAMEAKQAQSHRLRNP
jgi:hypothetical protein